MGKLPAYQWYPGDWKRDPAVGSLTPEARSFWREAIDVLFDSPNRHSFTATLEGWATLTRVHEMWITMFIEENKKSKVAKVTQRHGQVTILSRRMEKEEKARELARNRKRRERGHADVTHESPQSHNAPSVSSSSSSSKERKEKKEIANAIGGIGKELGDTLGLPPSIRSEAQDEAAIERRRQ